MTAPHIAEIQHAVAERFGIPMMEMTSDRRGREIARVRQVAMYLSRLMTPFSVPTIGKHFGDRDHTTVMHACKVVADRVERDRDFAAQIAELVKRLADDPNQGILPLHR